MDILLLILGLALILGGANFLTNGSAALPQRFRVPEFIVGPTTVAARPPHPPPPAQLQDNATETRTVRQKAQQPNHKPRHNRGVDLSPGLT